MATKKQKKKKVIDGVINDTKKNSKKSSSKSPKKKIIIDDVKPVEKTTKSPTETIEIETDEKIQVSPEDTSVVIVEAEDTSNTPSAENVDNTTIEDPITEEPAVEIEIREENSPKDNLDEVAEESSTSETEEEVEIIAEESTEESPQENETSSKDDDLDNLIEDIEKDEKKEQKARSKEKSKTSSQESDKKDLELSAKKRKKLPARALPFRILSVILALGTIAAVASAIVRITLTGIVPNKYLIPAIVGLALILLFYLFKTLRRKTHIPVLIILNLIGIALSVVSVFGFVKVQETMSFLFNNFNESKEYTVYDIIVSNKSNYSNLDDAKGKLFHSISNFVDTEKLETAARDQANATIAYEDGISSLLKNTYADNTYIAVLNAGTWDATLALNDGKNDYVGKYKVIGELKVEEEKKNENAESNLTTDSFTVFVSGIDTRTGLMLDRSLSDVNMIITVNPKTKNILMTTIPRDYYVQLHGTTGLRDKLTHAGALGGLPLSMATIEDLLDFKFSRYIRVNFNFVVNLVNTVGGITVYSDVDYTFNTLHPQDRKCTFHPGLNEVDGECALGFARERYAYADGDRHRGRNQEQVIEKVFEKLTNSTTFISHYSDILNSLSGSFDTNISASDITSLANMQLNDMAKWTVETYNLDGPTGMTYTYSYPNQLLSVMYPDETTVETAKQKIKQILSGTPEAVPTETTETIISE